MLKFKVTTKSGSVEVWLDSVDPNDRVALQYSKDDLEFRGWLESSFGAFGSRLGTTTTPIDLHYALFTQEAKERFNPELLEGSGIVTAYDPDIPEGAVT